MNKDDDTFTAASRFSQISALKDRVVNFSKFSATGESCNNTKGDLPYGRFSVFSAGMDATFKEES